MPSTASENTGNYIKLFRKFQRWGWYSDPNTKAVFIHLLLNANWQDGEFHGERVRAGECVFGRKKAAKALGLSEQMIRTALDHLRKTGEISTTKTTNRFSIIKIEKWAFYQGSEEGINQQINQKATSKQPASNHIQERKKGRREEYNNIYSWEAETIIAYLNEKTGRSFKAKTRSTASAISARIAEGYTVNDFKTVIDSKCEEWLDDSKMNQFLRPQTLFSPAHFEAYLEAAKKPAGEKEDPWSTWLG